VFVRAVLGFALLICGSYYWRLLLLCCFGPLGPYYDDFRSVYWNKLYLNKLCPASVMEGLGRRRAFG
jgi:hypothetical protein